MTGAFQGVVDHHSQLGGRWEFFPVSKYREQTFGYLPLTGLPANQSFRDRIGFQRFMQPVSPLLVLMGVADERLVLELF